MAAVGFKIGKREYQSFQTMCYWPLDGEGGHLFKAKVK